MERWLEQIMGGYGHVSPHIAVPGRCRHMNKGCDFKCGGLKELLA